MDWKMRVNVIAASMVIAAKRLVALQKNRDYEAGVIILQAEALEDIARTSALFGLVAIETEAGLNEAGFREFVEKSYGKEGKNKYLEVARSSELVCKNPDCKDCRSLIAGVESGFEKLRVECLAGIDLAVKSMADKSFEDAMIKGLGEDRAREKPESEKEEIYLLCMSANDAVQWCEDPVNRAKIGGKGALMAVFDAVVLRGRRGGKYLMTKAFGRDSSSPAVRDVWNQIGVIGAKPHEAQVRDNEDSVLERRFAKVH